MSSYIRYRDEALKNDAELRTEYDALALEYDIMQSRIEADQKEDESDLKTIIRYNNDHAN